MRRNSEIQKSVAAVASRTAGSAQSRKPAVEQDRHVAAEDLVGQAGEAVEDRPRLAGRGGRGKALQNFVRGARHGEQIVDRGDGAGLAFEGGHGGRGEDLAGAVHPGLGALALGNDKAVGEAERLGEAPALGRGRHLVEGIVAMGAPLGVVGRELEHPVAHGLASSRRLREILPLHVEADHRARIGEQGRDHHADPLPGARRRGDQAVHDLAGAEIGGPGSGTSELAPDRPADRGGLREKPRLAQLRRIGPAGGAVAGEPRAERERRPGKAERRGDAGPDQARGLDHPAPLAGGEGPEADDGQKVDLPQVAAELPGGDRAGREQAGQDAEHQPERREEDDVRSAPVHRVCPDHRLRPSSSRPRGFRSRPSSRGPLPSRSPERSRSAPRRPSSADGFRSSAARPACARRSAGSEVRRSKSRKRVRSAIRSSASR